MSRDRARDEVKHSHGVTTLSRGHSFSVVLHPEHKEAIRNLPDGGSHSFRDESKKRWVATRDGDQVHFHNPDQGYRHSASMSHLLENVEPSHMIRETALEILREAKEETHFINGRDVGGITTVPKKDISNKSQKAFDVFYNGDHIGHVETHNTTAVQKANSIRKSDTGKMKTKWFYQHKDPKNRTSFNHGSKKDATAELVAKHLQTLQESESTHTRQEAIERQKNPVIRARLEKMTDAEYQDHRAKMARSVQSGATSRSISRMSKRLK
jgi:hypothetical protein